MEILDLLWEWRIAVVAAVVVLVLLEALWVHVKLDGKFTARETLTNVVIMIGSEIGRKGTFPLRLAAFSAVFAVTPLRVPPTLATAALCYVLVEFLYYWKHRWLHASDLGWSLHVVHHSTTELNLTTPGRDGWIQRVLDEWFYLPVVMLGFHPGLVLFHAELVVFAQLWLHTRTIGRLGWLEGIVNTPSAHRVHHAAAREMSGKNLASTFVIWDRLFGTYQPEPRGPEIVYGTEDGHLGHNVLKIQFGTLWKYISSRFRPAPKPAH